MPARQCAAAKQDVHHKSAEPTQLEGGDGLGRCEFQIERSRRQHEHRQKRRDQRAAPARAEGR